MTVEKLNELLGRELGRNPLNEPVYRWAFSEDLYWPTHATGRTVKKKIQVPLFGEGGTLATTTEIVVPEYRRDRMCHKLHKQWLITKWCAPEELDRWTEIFPQADYPSRGYYINTDYYRSPENPPSLIDTEFFIRQMKDQRSMKFKDRLEQFESERDRKERSAHNEVEDELQDMVPAMANPQPGTRSWNVSFPSTQKEIANGRLKNQ